MKAAALVLVAFVVSTSAFGGDVRVTEGSLDITQLSPPWATADVGAVGTPGTSLDLNDTFYVAGAGADIWDNEDAFRFVYQQGQGDATIVARVVAEQATHMYAKAGVMFRERLDPGAVHVILDVKPDGGIELMTRHTAGESTFYVAGAIASSTPWLKLVRSGTLFTGYHSADGATWTEVGSVDLPEFAPAFLAGLAVTSHDVDVLNSSTFDHVAVSVHVSAHNLIIDGGFERTIPPALGPPGWISDYPFRQVPAKSETNQPHTGTKNGACWSPDALDCGIYQDLMVPATGGYTLRLYATSDREGGLVGVNVNGDGVASRDVEASGFGNYQPYTIPFRARAGDVVRVWMYSPEIPGYVVIDDVSLTLDEPIVVTGGSWEIHAHGGGFGSFTLTSGEFSATGTYDGGYFQARACNPCVPGQVVGLKTFFENQTPMTDVSFARGSASADGRAYGYVEFGGAVVLDGTPVVIPTPTDMSYPGHVTVTAPFTISGDLRGFDVLLRRDPLLLFDVPLAGHGTVTLELIVDPGPSLTFYRITYVFEPTR
jgi:hypothetical protein